MKARLRFGQAPSGLIVPIGLEVQGQYSSTLHPLYVEPELPGAGVVPRELDIWHGTIDIQKTFESVRFAEILAPLLRISLLASSQVISDKDRNREILRVLSHRDRNAAARFLNANKNGVLVAPYGGLLAIAFAARYCNDEAPHLKELRWDDLYRLLVACDTAVSFDHGHEEAMTGDPESFLLPLVERCTFERAFEQLSSSLLLWCWRRADARLAGRRSRFEVAAERLGKAPPHRLLAAAAFTGVTTHNVSHGRWIDSPLAITRRAAGLSKDGHDLLDQLWARALSLRDFQRLLRRAAGGRGAQFDPLGALQAMKSAPLIRNRRAIMAVSPSHAIAAVNEDAISNHAVVFSKQAAADDLSALYEECAHIVLETTFGDRYQRIPRMAKRKSADGLLWSESGVVVFEIKSTLAPARSSMRWRSSAAVIEEARRGDLRKGWEQIAATVQSIADGVIPMWIKYRHPVAASVIIVRRAFPFFGGPTSIYQAMFPEIVPPVGWKMLPPQILSFADLVDLGRYTTLQPLHKTLMQKMSIPRSCGEPLSVFLGGRMPGTSKSTLRTELRRAMEEFVFVLKDQA